MAMPLQLEVLGGVGGGFADGFGYGEGLVAGRTSARCPRPWRMEMLYFGFGDDAGHHLDGFDGIGAHGGFAGEHDGVGAVVDGVGDVGDFGAGGAWDCRSSTPASAWR